jgi:hypothetical protein
VTNLIPLLYCCALWSNLHRSEKMLRQKSVIMTGCGRIWRFTFGRTGIKGGRVKEINDTINEDDGARSLLLNPYWIVTS